MCLLRVQVLKTSIKSLVSRAALYDQSTAQHGLESDRPLQCLRPPPIVLINNKTSSFVVTLTYLVEDLVKGVATFYLPKSVERLLSSVSSLLFRA